MKTGDGVVHWVDHVRRRAEYSGGADHDGDRARAGHRRADGARLAPAAGAADFCAARAGGQRWANRWRLIPLNPEIYAIPYVPFHGNGLDAIWIAAAALAISVAATIVPARSASRILPVEILRFE